VAGQARTFRGFIAGRILSGVGGAGIMTLSLILVLELAGQKRRGLFLGLVNAGFTTGVSLGAVIAGALVSVMGWVGWSFVSAFAGLVLVRVLTGCRGHCSGARRRLRFWLGRASS
jgi:MFS family permease